MKKIILSISLIVNSLFLIGCAPVIQGASTVSSVISISNDRRSIGKILDDKTIASRLLIWYSEDPTLSDVHLNFMVYNKTVLITGEVSTPEIRIYASKQAQLQVPNISQIFNEIKLGPSSGLISRVKDSAITIQVEFLFQNQEVFHPIHVRVMTENQVVYLMGALTKREANMAAKTAAKAKGAYKVVKLFDYLKTRPKAEIERDKLKELEDKRKAEFEKQQVDLETKKADLQRQIRALSSNTTATNFSPEYAF
ncbi:periplasmic or secreted lipoprotein-like protein [Candidatus Ruthia magnifica str. Cm (Calyptogena magnifica)]|uniref:Periplasmic or secreted lipoprotein-like protein n=1 Tax=Ruthia magnifica subsp. Calyptogena magnifica TaxID=413404 RepID=A1AVA3_RUTMC|nr:BON domain-containing protein [Candidatus Ruthturnera calyptogenae]ABL01860.1 periplasmic or secreted lipoprotein-like protein [Candidatus Ruthia magnifica str. Cm (Calyptogena magnifica)]